MQRIRPDFETGSDRSRYDAERRTRVIRTAWA
jgi:hypothetical protein